MLQVWRLGSRWCSPKPDVCIKHGELQAGLCIQQSGLVSGPRLLAMRILSSHAVLIQLSGHLKEIAKAVYLARSYPASKFL